MALIATDKVFNMKQQMRKKRVMLLTDECTHLVRELADLPREEYKRGRWWQIRKRLKDIRKELSSLATFPPLDSGEQKEINFA